MGRQEMEEEELARTVAQLARVGYGFAIKFSPEVKELGTDALVASVEGQLEAGAFGKGILRGEEEIEEGLEALTKLAQAMPNEFFAKAFVLNEGGDGTSEHELTPRMQRLLLQLALGQALEEGKASSVWFTASVAYLTLLQVPGALSYQMFRPALCRKIIEPLHKEENPKTISALLGKVCDLLAREDFARRLHENDLLGETVSLLVIGGASCPEALRTRVKECLEVLQRDTAESEKKAGGEHAMSDGADDKNEEEEEEEVAEDEDFADGDKGPGIKHAARKKKLGVAGAVESFMLRSLLEIFQVEKSGRLLEWGLEVFQDQTRHEANEQKSAAEFSEIAVRLVEHVCFQVVDRTEKRAIAARNAMRVLGAVDSKLYCGTLYRFAKYLSKLSHSKETAQRTFACDTAGLAFTECKLDDDLVQGISELILFRTEDKIPAVRISALKALGLMMTAGSAFSPQGDGEEAGEVEGKQEVQGVSGVESLAIKRSIAVLRRRIADPKPMVRRAAVKALQSFLQSSKVNQQRGLNKIIEKDFAALCARSRDTSSIIRMAVLQTADDFLARETDARVANLWASTVLPLMYDTEHTIQKAAREAVRRSLLDRIVETKSDPTGPDAEHVWALVSHFNDENWICVQKAVFDAATDDKNSLSLPIVVRSLEAAVKASLDAKPTMAVLQCELGAWTLLDLIVGGDPAESAPTASSAKSKTVEKARKALHTDTVMAAWKRRFVDEDDEGEENGGAMEDEPPAVDMAALKIEVDVHVLSVMMGASSSIPATEATDVAGVLLSMLLELNIHTNVIRKVLVLLVTMCKMKAPNTKECRSMIRTWGEMVQKKCEDILEAASKGQGVADISQAERALFVTGEMAVLGLDPDDKNKAWVPLRDKLVTLAMGLIALDSTQATSVNDDGAAALSSLRPHAFVATGKICLRDEKVAKRATTMLVRELDQCKQSDVIRSNIIVILGDMCRRYTNMIDPHMDTICNCLADPSTLVRRHALILITGLLQEDYIKWRGLLFARYLMCFVDPDAEIRDMVAYSLKEIFPTKNPGLYHGQFVELMFALNRFSTAKYHLAEMMWHKSDASSTTEATVRGPMENDRERYASRISGASPECADLRFKLYTLLLQNLTDTHRLEVTNKICRDILGEMLDGAIKLPRYNRSADSHAPEGDREVTDQLLSDCFRILCSPDIRVKASSTSLEGVGADDEDVAATTSQVLQEKMAEAKNKVLGKLERKNLMEHVIPMVISFYRMLQRERSPHLRLASRYLRVLMKDYKEEMSQVLGADKVLAQEIEYDLAQSEKEEQRKMEREQQQQEKRRAKRRRSSMGPPDSSRKNRRLSGVTFQPSSRDVAARSVNGVLKTPIPKSSKKRRQSIGSDVRQQLGSNPARRLVGSENRNAAANARTPRTVTLKGTPATALSTSLRSQRKWALEPSRAGDKTSRDLDTLSQNLTQQLLAIDPSSP